MNPGRFRVNSRILGTSSQGLGWGLDQSKELNRFKYSSIALIAGGGDGAACSKRVYRGDASNPSRRGAPASSTKSAFY